MEQEKVGQRLDDVGGWNQRGIKVEDSLGMEWRTEKEMERVHRDNASLPILFFYRHFLTYIPLPSSLSPCLSSPQPFIHKQLPSIYSTSD
jgi:hypothetical protein